jgi:Zn-dependent protease with chaperone function
MFIWGQMAELNWVPIFEWVATALSLVAFYFCIAKKAFSFLIFMGADLLWLGAAGAMGHWALVIQQILYLGMNVVGYWIWRAEERRALQRAIPWQEKDENGEEAAPPLLVERLKIL